MEPLTSHLLIETCQEKKWNLTFCYFPERNLAKNVYFPKEMKKVSIMSCFTNKILFSLVRYICTKWLLKIKYYSHHNVYEYVHSSFLDPLCLTNEVKRKKKLIAENM